MTDPETSRDAAEKVVKSGALAKQEQQVLNAIKLRIDFCNYKWRRDFTTKDIAYQMANGLRPYYKCYDICRKRFSGLYEKGKIERTGARRDGCCVWELR